MTDVNLNKQDKWSHYVATHDVYIRESYLILLAAIAFEDRVINPDESNYLQNLCESMSPISFDSILVRLKTFDADQFNEVTTLIKKNRLELLFFIDALLLCNSDTGISEDEARLLSNLADTLGLSDSMSRFGVLTSVAILKHDRDIFLQALSLINDDHGLDAVCQCYLKGWIDEKIGWGIDLVKGKIPAGKYIIYKPIKITMDTSIQNSELIFTKHGLITIDSQKELTINKTSLLNCHIICKPKSSLVATNITVTGGRGITAEKHALLELDNSCFKASYITATQLSNLLITNTKFDEFIDAPALNISECCDVTLENCAFEQPHATQLNAKSIKYCAIRANTSFMYIANSKFNNCSSSEDGGAIRFQSCLFGVDNCEFVKCHSDHSGGAIAISGETFIESKSIELTSARLKTFLNSIKPITCYEPGFVLWRDRTYQFGFDKQSLVSKSRFVNCSSSEAGGAILDGTDTIRIVDCNFDDNNALTSHGDVAILGRMSLTKWGVDTSLMRGTSLTNKTVLNEAYSKIVNCNFSGDPKTLMPGLRIQRLYEMLFISGCTFQNRTILLQYSSIDYNQAGLHLMPTNWLEVLGESEKVFSAQIDLNNTFENNGSNAKEFDDEFEQVEYEMNNPQLKISFDRHLLPSELQNKG